MNASIPQIFSFGFEEFWNEQIIKIIDMKNLKIILPAILFTILFSCEEGNHSRNDFAAEESVSAIDLENNSETPLSSTAPHTKMPNENLCERLICRWK